MIVMATDLHGVSDELRQQCESMTHQPIIWLSLNSTKHSALEVSEYARIKVRDRVQTLPGVSNVLLFAEREYAMRIWLSRERMAALGVTVQDVNKIIKQHQQMQDMMKILKKIGASGMMRGGLGQLFGMK